jgi:hypothetical protein
LQAKHIYVFLWRIYYCLFMCVCIYICVTVCVFVFVCVCSCLCDCVGVCVSDCMYVCGCVCLCLCVRFVVDKLALGQVLPSTQLSPANYHSTNYSTFINHPVTNAILISILSYEKKRMCCVWAFECVWMCGGVKCASDFETTGIYIKISKEENTKTFNG